MSARMSACPSCGHYAHAAVCGEPVKIGYKRWGACACGQRRAGAPAPDERTYWNGEPTPARIVRVIVGPSPVPTWWCAGLAGTEREAVEVRYGVQPPLYLDNENGSGWAKVTVGHGSPGWGHSSLPVSRVLDDAGPRAASLTERQ